jgi:hypothetical protein
MVFENSYKPIQIIIEQIKDEAKQWAEAVLVVSSCR